MRRCQHCEVSIADRHSNAIRCVDCARVYRAQPSGVLTKAQERRIMGMLNKHSRAEIAIRLGTSQATVTRWLARQGLKSNSWTYDKQTVAQVLTAYSKLGRLATQKQFPRVNVRSIVERNQMIGSLPPRQIRWSAPQIVLAAKMAGMVHFKDQAKVFGRPNAHAGSIRSLWSKRLKVNSYLHGLSTYRANQILLPGFPVVEVFSYGPAKKRFRAKVCLWCDAVGMVRPDMPKFIADGISAMAEFQAWLFHPVEPKRALMALRRK